MAPNDTDSLPVRTQNAMLVQLDHLQKPGEVGVQESDLLERMADGESRNDAATAAVRLVSLGCFCGTKLSFKKIGRGSETLPFDWIRTRLSGVLRYLREDFKGYYDFVTRRAVPDTGYMVMYRDYYHSFWHDDPTDPAMHERYTRRIERFGQINARDSPVLFVRAAATTAEISGVGELLAELIDRFGAQASLLLILDCQNKARGPAHVKGMPNLLLFYLAPDAHDAQDGAPYTEPVLRALDWAVGRPTEAIPFSSLDEAAACCDSSSLGLEGMGGLRSFEELTEEEMRAREEADASGVPLSQPSLWPPALSGTSAELELLGQRASPAEERRAVDQLQLVSIGSGPGPKMALQELGAAKEALPFDWLRISVEGLQHFFRTQFVDLFDYGVRRRVSSTPSSSFAFRSRWHSFWHDDPDSSETRASYRLRISNLQRIAREASAARPLLFVRAAAAAGELLIAGTLLRILRKELLGGGEGAENACLLLILPEQRSHIGAYVALDCPDVLLYFAAPLAEGASGGSAYRSAIEAAAAWTVGDPLQAAEVPNLQALVALIDADGADLARGRALGPNGLAIFEAADSAGSDMPATSAASAGAAAQNGPASSAAAVASAAAAAAVAA
eukprot:TRINITY_DN57427_c0_g1_i1.p1 TRINITY_DN57427_c0_g1~~TRINITY_DN57427_c0_g1_i1.p1  ORF type:complete len:618 (+),score=152.36 TRINITY_DN57427_c0_g1_i1:68-1921(+)